MERYLESRPARLERWVVAAALIGTTVLFWRGAIEPFSIPKLTVALVAGVVVLAVGTWRLLESGAIRVPGGAAQRALAAFIVAALVSWALAPSWWRALAGQRARGSGLALYLAAALLFVAVLRSFERRHVERLVWVVLGGTVVVALYAVIQHRGGDWYTWDDSYGANAPFSTLGNVNFVSGFLACAFPLLLWPVFRFRRPAGIVAVVVGALVLLYVLGITRSSQGLVAAPIAAGAVLWAWALDRWPGRRRPLLAGAGVLAVAGVAVIGLGLSGSGPGERLGDNGFEFRKYFWDASLEMIAEHPIVGVGFDSWAGYYREARSAEAAMAQGLSTVADEPHSVPLAMFANGGLLLGLAYLAFVGLTGATLVRGWWRSDGRTRELLTVLGGAWLAYQVQSLVSIDIPPLVVLHFVLAGAIVTVSAAASWRERTVPFLVVTRGSRRPVLKPRAAGRPAVVAAVLLAVLGGWQVTRPLRADVAMNDALLASARNEPRSLGKILDAARIAKWDAEYWNLVGQDAARHQSAVVALDGFEKAIKRDPRAFEPVLSRARVAKTSGDLGLAYVQYQRALELEPQSWELKVEFAPVLLDLGKAEEAVPLLESVVADRPTTDSAWVFLGDARRILGDFDGAREAYDRAIEIAPTSVSDGRLQLLQQAEDRAEAGDGT